MVVVPGPPAAVLVMVVGEELVELAELVDDAVDTAAADMACLTGKGSSPLEEMVTLGAAETLVPEEAEPIRLDGCCCGGLGEAPCDD